MMDTPRARGGEAPMPVPPALYIDTPAYLDSVRNRASAQARRHIAQARRSHGQRARRLRARAFRAERAYRQLAAALAGHSHTTDHPAR